MVFRFNPKVIAMRSRDVHQEALASRSDRTADQWVVALAVMKAEGQWFQLQDTAQVASRSSRTIRG